MKKIWECVLPGASNLTLKDLTDKKSFITVQTYG